MDLITFPAYKHTYRELDEQAPIQIVPDRPYGLVVNEQKQKTEVRDVLYMPDQCILQCFLWALCRAVSASAFVHWHQFFSRRLLPRWKLSAYTVCYKRYKKNSFGFLRRHLLGVYLHRRSLCMLSVLALYSVYFCGGVTAPGDIKTIIWNNFTGFPSPIRSESSASSSNFVKTSAVCMHVLHALLIYFIPAPCFSGHPTLIPAAFLHLLMSLPVTAAITVFTELHRKPNKLTRHCSDRSHLSWKHQRSNSFLKLHSNNQRPLVCVCLCVCLISSLLKDFRTKPLMKSTNIILLLLLLLQHVTNMYYVEM